MAKKTQSSASKALRLYWKPTGVVNERNAQAFRAWLEKHAGGIDIATFIHSATYAKKHSKALLALLE